MVVLHFIDSLRMGGKERQVVELLKGLKKRRDIELVLVCMGSEDFYRPEIEELDIRIIYLTRRCRWDPFVFWKFYKVVGRYQPDLIHTNCWMTSFYSLPISRMKGVKLVNGSMRNAFTSKLVRGLKGSNAWLRWHLERMLLRWSDYTIANSRAGLVSRGLQESNRNVVIYNGFDFSRVENVGRNNPFKTKKGWGDRKVVGMVGEFSKFKDYEMYLSAAQMVLSHREDVVFLAIGSGENLETIEKRVPIECEGIKFLGMRKDVEEIVSCFDIGVLSSHSEGISNAIMEYMAFGKPVVATDTGGTRELVLDKRSGFLVPPGDPKALAENVEYLLDHPEVAKKMGETGRSRLKDSFSLEKMVENTVRVYALAASREGNLIEAEADGCRGKSWVRIDK